MYRHKKSEETARKVADFIKSSIKPKFKKGFDVGIILGTGWGDVLMEKMNIVEAIKLPYLEEFRFLRTLEEIEGHDRELIIGKFAGKKVAALRGRIHMNESHNTEELVKVVRLQVEMLFHLGVKHLILTNAAGSLSKHIHVGSIVAHNGFITEYAPPRPLYGGEFVSPEDVLKEENNKKIILAAYNTGLDYNHGAGAMVRGPDFEGRKHDKRILRENGANMAMMSILPECAIAALYPEVEVYAMSFITNDDSEKHLHETNQERAKAASGKLGDLLFNLVQSL